jgi:2-keto-4-pentenoate hydratase/2-oxohepta-3-ene-1,7-dioic acid hydratase in catechol pathway
MRLVTFESPSGERRAGALAGAGRVVDLAVASAALLDGDGAGHPLPADMLALLEQEDGIETARAALDHGRATGAGMVDLAQVRLLSPLPRPRSLRDFMLVEQHVLGSFAEVPAEWHAIPVYWKGNADAVLGPDESIRWPVYTRQLDFELEMAAVIGRRAEAVDVEEAWSCIAGYTIFNDWSARDYQMREMSVGIGPGLGKDFGTSIGPCIATPDELEPLSARMTAKVNGELWCDGSLESMLFSFGEVISHLSAEQVLLPGDVIGSGTIARGCGLELDRWIEVGDVVELEIEGIGNLRTEVAPPRAEVERLIIGMPAPAAD